MILTTTIDNFVLRSTTIEDCPLILRFIQELADYEKLSHEVVATAETLEETLFGATAYAEVFIGEFNCKPVSYALFFHNFYARQRIWQEHAFLYCQTCR